MLTRACQRYRWDVRERAPLDHLRGFEGVHPLLVQLLWNRGIVEREDVAEFLRGGQAPLHPPGLMLGMDRAIERLLRARAADEHVVIYGDYDVDGVCSTALLTQCFGLAGLRVEPFLPRRDVEGYGLNRAALGRLREAGADLVVAVDCGISGAPEVAYAREIGLQVIVVDHHHVPAVLPDAAAVINPKQPGCAYPFKDLCAAGLAFKLAQALFARLEPGREVAEQWLDLVALATVADVVPLVGENRALVLRGLPRLNPPSRPGLAALARKAGVPDGKIDSHAIGFILAPRLNAAGRLEDARTSLRLLLCESADEASALAERLDATNRERQRLTDLGLEQAREIVRARPDLPKLLLVADEEYASGIVGLIAARLTEEFGRPSIVAQIDDGEARGSARSIDGFHIAEALTRCTDLLTRHGGHARAAGFTVPTENLDALRERLQAIARAEISDAAVEPALSVDAMIDLDRFDATLYQLIQPLEPAGFGNPPPVFLSRRVPVLSARTVGKGPPGHLKLKLRGKRTVWDTIGFGRGEDPTKPGDLIDVVYSVELHTWNGTTSTQLRVQDLRPTMI